MSQDSILQPLEIAIRKSKPLSPALMCGDKWVVSSAMQKAIRRGLVDIALSAAASLWHQDRQNFWRRLHIAALEDVGVGHIDAVVQVLAATASPSFRKHVGDLQVGLYLTRLLCEATKCRAADELFLQLERSSAHDDMRKHFAKAEDSLLIAYITDESEPLSTRAMALWYLAGTQKYTSDIIPQRKGSMKLAAEVVASLAVSPAITHGCIAVMKRTQWPLALFTPLIYQETQKQPDALIIEPCSIPDSPCVEGIPHFAADVYTRIGQSCFRQLQKDVPELREYSVKQIGVAVFYLEGGLLDKVLLSPMLAELQQAGELADAEGLGLPLLDYMNLRNCLMHNMPTLTDIRQEQLQRYLNGANA